jgi:hypothetical protein
MQVLGKLLENLACAPQVGGQLLGALQPAVVRRMVAGW